MLNLSCYSNPYLDTFEAKVIEINKLFINNGSDTEIIKYKVLLDQNYFFPGGGGQVADQAYIGEIKVEDFLYEDEKLYCITNVSPICNNIYFCCVNFGLRYDYMQQHTAEHIVSGLANKLFSCNNVGFHMNETNVTLDLDKFLNDDEFRLLWNETNKVVSSNHSVRDYVYDSYDEISYDYRCKKEIKGTLRIVDIEDVDKCACCSLHVQNTFEIGPIILFKERYKQGSRITLYAANRATMLINKYIDIIDDINRMFSSNITNIKEKINNYIEKQNDFVKNYDFVKEELLKHRIDNIDLNKQSYAIIKLEEFYDDKDVNRAYQYLSTILKKDSKLKEIIFIIKGKKQTRFVYYNLTNDNDIRKLKHLILKSDKFKVFSDKDVIRGLVAGKIEEIIQFDKRYL